MAWNIAYFNAPVAVGAGNGVPAGVFIPRTALPGLTTPAELTDANRERKVAYALLATQLYERLNALPNKLGLAVSRPTPTGVADNRINQSFSLTVQFVVYHDSNTLSILPLSDSNVGFVGLGDVFPGADHVAAEGAISEPGIVVPNSLVTTYGGGIPVAANGNECRSWINGLFCSITLGLEPNAAVVTASRGAAVGFVPPANFTGANAITGLAVETLALASFFSITYSLTLQLQLNQTAQTFDLAA